MTVRRVVLSAVKDTRMSRSHLRWLQHRFFSIAVVFTLRVRGIFLPPVAHPAGTVASGRKLTQTSKNMLIYAVV